jgi:hypothetical protein
MASLIEWAAVLLITVVFWAYLNWEEIKKSNYFAKEFSRRIISLFN